MHFIRNLLTKVTKTNSDMVAAAIRTMATPLQASYDTVVTGDHAARPARLIMVTGAHGGQGTTTVDVALALHAAVHGSVALSAAPSQGAAVLLGVPAVGRGETVQVTPSVTLAAPSSVVTNPSSHRRLVCPPFLDW